ncbi:hypothetical protein Tco_0495033, partial [Tanacetum coccineum]
MAVHISLAVLHASTVDFNSYNEYARGRIWTFKDALPHIFTIRFSVK